MTDRDPLFQVLDGFARAQLRLLQQCKRNTDFNSRDIAAPPGAQPGLINESHSIKDKTNDKRSNDDDGNDDDE